MFAQSSPKTDPVETLGTNGKASWESVRLTRKEAQLLDLLKQNTGRCLSRAYLLETIWGYRNGTKTRTLDVHIQRLRRKLGPETSMHILTVLRTGYGWEEHPTRRAELG
jgi:DNA-binding response OmpR family regulator